MNIIEIIGIGIGLSMDAAAVTVSDAMGCAPGRRARLAALPVLFGFFQGAMPVLGFYLGGIFSSYIEKVSSLLVFIILAAIGAKMIWDAFHEEDGVQSGMELTWRLAFTQAVATSIDAFAVGVGFRAVSAPLWSSAGVIALTTFLISAACVALGRFIGDKIGGKAQILGGIILIIIAIKALLQ